jgi:hypothetical protein
VNLLMMHSPWAKALLDSIAVMSGINPGPTARTSFSATCKAHADFLALAAHDPPTGRVPRSCFFKNADFSEVL